MIVFVLNNARGMPHWRRINLNKSKKSYVKAFRNSRPVQGHKKNLKSSNPQFYLVAHGADVEIWFEYSTRQQRWKWEAEQLSLAALGFLLLKLIQLLQRFSDVVAMGFRPITITELISISVCWPMRRCICQMVQRPAHVFAKCCDACTMLLKCSKAFEWLQKFIASSFFIKGLM